MDIPASTSKIDRQSYEFNLVDSSNNELNNPTINVAEQDYGSESNMNDAGLKEGNDLLPFAHLLPSTGSNKKKEKQSELSPDYLFNVDFIHDYYLKNHRLDVDFASLGSHFQKILLAQAINEKELDLIEMILDAPSLKRDELSQEGFGLQQIKKLITVGNFLLASRLLANLNFPLGCQAQQNSFNEILTSLLFYPSQKGNKSTGSEIKPLEYYEHVDQTAALLLQRKDIKCDTYRLFINTKSSDAAKKICSWLEIAIYCKKPKAAIEIVNDEKFDPKFNKGGGLLAAVRMGRKDIVKALLDTNKIHVDMLLGKYDETALFIAARQHKDIVELLLSYNANPNIISRQSLYVPFPYSLTYSQSRLERRELRELTKKGSHGSI